MLRHWRVVMVLALLAGLVVSVQPVSAHGGGNSVDDHWLAAACPASLANGRLGHRTMTTDFGVAVEHLAKVTGPVTFRCNVEADDYHNWLQFYAEDNSPTASVTVSLFRQDMVTGGAPELLYTLTTTDRSGVQRAELFLENDLSPNESTYMYYLELVIDRSSTLDQVRLYSVSLRDVL